MADKANKPCCPERVRALIANKNSTFTDADAEWLESMTAEQLAHLELMAQEKRQEPKVNEPARKDPVTLDGFLSAAPPEIRGLLNAGLRQLDKARSEMISGILANESNKFTEEQLKKMTQETLEGISALVAVKEEQRVPSWLGQGGAGIPSHLNAGGEEEEPYVPMTINFSKEG